MHLPDQTEIKPFQLDMFFGVCQTWCRVPFILGMRKDLPDYPAIVWPFRSQPKVISFPHACKQRFIF